MGWASRRGRERGVRCLIRAGSLSFLLRFSLPVGVFSSSRAMVLWVASQRWKRDGRVNCISPASMHDSPHGFTFSSSRRVGHLGVEFSFFRLFHLFSPSSSFPLFLLSSSSPFLPSSFSPTLLHFMTGVCFPTPLRSPRTVSNTWTFVCNSSALLSPARTGTRKVARKGRRVRSDSMYVCHDHGILYENGGT